MSKYYVRSGNLEVVISAIDERDAVSKAVMYASENDKLCSKLFVADYFYVNERGFDTMGKGDYMIHTEEVIIDLLGWDEEE
jgi:hypothetical protein